MLARVFAMLNALACLQLIRKFPNPFSLAIPCEMLRKA